MAYTYGRCRPCGLIYRWNGSPKRRLRHARCGDCDAKLTATAHAERMIARGRVELCMLPPMFVTDRLPDVEEEVP